jgi:hypothetical protein
MTALLAAWAAALSTEEVLAVAGYPDNQALARGGAAAPGYNAGECRGSITPGKRSGRFHTRLFSLRLDGAGINVGAFASKADAERALADEARRRGLRLMFIKDESGTRSVADGTPGGAAHAAAGASAAAAQQRGRGAARAAAAVPLPATEAAPADSGDAGPLLPPGFVEPVRPVQPRKAAVKTPVSAAAPGAAPLPAPAAAPSKRRAADADDDAAGGAGGDAAAPPKRLRASKPVAVPQPPAAEPIVIEDDAVAPPHADVAAFLRGITPPLSCLQESLAALPRSGISMAHFRQAAAESREGRQSALQLAAEGLRISLTGDRMALEMAVHTLRPQQQ